MRILLLFLVEEKRAVQPGCTSMYILDNLSFRFSLSQIFQSSRAFSCS